MSLRELVGKISINGADTAASELGKVDSAFDSTSKKLGGGFVTAGEKIKGVGNGLGNVAKAFAPVSIAAGGAITGAIKSAISWEDAFSDVRKTVDATETQFTGLEDTIMSMSKTIPVTANELASIMAEGGQLGIETDNLETFTRTVADLKVATNLGDSGGSQMAQFANITGMDQKNFDRLGAAIVHLGNNSATTEQDIMNMSMRLAGAGSQIGMTEPEILGMSAALSSVGIEAEAGGSAMSKVMIGMASAVELGGKDLKKFADLTGYTAEGFQEMFRTDPTFAIDEFVSALGNAEENGSSAIQVLDDLGMTEVRLRDTLLRAAGANELFSDTLYMGVGAWDANTALTDEAAAKYGTLQSQMTITMNSIKALGIEIGQSLTPYLAIAAEKIQGFIGAWQGLSPNTQDLIIKIGIGLALITPLLGALSIGFNMISTVITGVGVAIGFLASPIGIVVALFAGAAFLIVSNWETIKTAAATAMETIRTTATSVVEGMKSAWNSFKTTASNAWHGIKSAAASAIDSIISKWNALKTLLSKPLKAIVNIGGGIVSGAKGIASKVTGAFKPHKTGLNTVPYDGYLAELHEGETVLPKKTAELYRGMGGNLSNVPVANNSKGGTSVNAPINIYITGNADSQTVNDIGEEVRKVLGDTFRNLQLQRA